MTLNKTLKIKQSAGNKHDKACININLAYNIIKSYKFKLWFIKKTVKP